MVVRDILPERVYSDALDAAKRTNYLCMIPQNGNMEILIPPSEARPMPAMPSDVAAFWSMFRTEVCAAVNRAVCERFRPLMDAHIRWMRRIGLIDRTPAIEDSALQVFARKDSRVPPHHHALYEATSCLIYLAENGGDTEAGTVLNSYPVRFWPIRDRVIVTGRGIRQHHKSLFFQYNTVPQDRVGIAKTVAYTPNTLVAMLNTPWSMHSMTEQHDFTRRLLLFGTLYERAAFRPLYQNVPGFILYAEDQPAAAP